MIYIGVTGWGDYDSLYAAGTSPKDKLKEYAGHFPIVEVDASFYKKMDRLLTLLIKNIAGSNRLKYAVTSKKI